MEELLKLAQQENVFLTFTVIDGISSMSASFQNGERKGDFAIANEETVDENVQIILNFIK